MSHIRLSMTSSDTGPSSSFSREPCRCIARRFPLAAAAAPPAARGVNTAEYNLAPSCLPHSITFSDQPLAAAAILCWLCHSQLASHSREDTQQHAATKGVREWHKLPTVLADCATSICFMLLSQQKTCVQPTHLLQQCLAWLMVLLAGVPMSLAGGSVASQPCLPTG